MKSTTQHVGTQIHPDDRGMHTASAHHTHSGPRNITLTAKRGGSGTHYFKGCACSLFPSNDSGLQRGGAGIIPALVNDLLSCVDICMALSSA